MAERLLGKITIVTGSGSGIGRACALALAAEGAKVYHTDIDESSAARTHEAIVNGGGDSVFAQQDVGDEKRWDSVFSGAAECFGAVNVLVNNAGVAIGGAIATYSYDDWNRQMAVNLGSVFLGTRAGIRAMSQSGGGSIVNMSSMAALRGAPMMSAYCTSKGGVFVFSKSAALECAQAGYDIRVNSVHPGLIDTPMHAGLHEGGIETTAKAATAMARAGQPAEVASTVVFLASDESSYTTGAQFIVDGGMAARM